MLFVAILLVALASADKGGCDFDDTLPNALFQDLIQRVKSKNFFEDKLAVLKQWASNNTLGLTSNQTVGILNTVSMSSQRVQVVEAISKFILTLECQGIVSILKTLSFSGDKFEILKLTINLANRADLKVNKESIIAQWSFSSDKEQARKIIDDSKPRSCLFGPADIPLFAFIIDVSGSMSERFKDTDGTVYTRLGYVQKDLITVMNTTLQPTQQFNIIQFSSGAAAWKPGVVPVNSANIASASAYTRALNPNGSTYMLAALKLAFSDPKVAGVYFLSDGEPSDSAEQIINFCVAVKKPVNTIAFKAPAAGSKFLLRMALASKGSFRDIPQ